MPESGPAGNRTSDYSYDLPAHRIAQYPQDRREDSRLMELKRATGGIRHRRFSDLVDLLAPSDLIVVNETRVFPARLRGRRASGADAEVLLLRSLDAESRTWSALVRPGGKLKPGREITVSDELEVRILDSTPGGERIVHLETALPPLEAIDRYGEVPLPPYLGRPATDADQERYQTVYARESGSVAAPTAGLHFSSDLIDRIRDRGVGFAPLLLHVGVGTFRPVESDDPAAHAMHSEWYRVPAPTALAIQTTREAGGAVWAVGTTTVRTLEAVAREHGRVEAVEGWTDIFIRPPYQFRAVDRMITNFHLPRSTLLMLVAAFAGFDNAMAAYQVAIDEDYRFYSYGDAMAIV